MTKQQIMLYLDLEVVDACKKRQLNVSALVNDILRKVLATELDAEEVTMAILQEHREGAIKKIAELTKQHANVLSVLEKEVLKYDTQIKSSQERLEEMKRSKLIAETMRALNSEIIERNFNFEEIVKSPQIDKLRSYGLTIDDNWLKRQIQRIELFRV